MFLIQGARAPMVTGNSIRRHDDSGDSSTWLLVCDVQLLTGFIGRAASTRPAALSWRRVLFAAPTRSVRRLVTRPRLGVAACRLRLSPGLRRASRGRCGFIRRVRPRARKWLIDAVLTVDLAIGAYGLLVVALDLGSRGQHPRDACLRYAHLASATERTRFHGSSPRPARNGSGTKCLSLHACRVANWRLAVTEVIHGCRASRMKGGSAPARFPSGGNDEYGGVC